jgi:hypothetical protein
LIQEAFHFYFDNEKIKILKSRKNKCAMFSKHGNFMCLSGGISISENRRENKDVFCVFKSNYTFPEEIGETK